MIKNKKKFSLKYVILLIFVNRKKNTKKKF